MSMHHWTVHAKVEFPIPPPDVRTRGGQSQPFHAQLRNVSFALIYFMGFPAIWSTLQPFQICIYNSKFSKWTFSNDSQLMGKRFITNFHASLESTCKSRISNTSTRCQNQGGQSQPFDATLRNVSFALIYFMGFPAIWSTLQPFQICIYNSKFSKWTFSNDSQLMGKRFITNFHASLESTCKSRISNTSTRCQNQGGQSQPFNAQLRNVSFALIYFMGFPAIWSTLQPFQICIYNSKFSKWTFSNDSQLIGKRFITNVHASLDSTCKSRISNTSTRCQNQGGQSQPFNATLRNVSFALIYFMGFPAIWSTLQPFQICIYNSKFSKWTFSNDSQLMGKRFLTNLCSSLETTCKSRISNTSTRCQNQGGSITTFRCSTQKCKFCIDIFYGVSCNMKHITAISNLHLQ